MRHRSAESYFQHYKTINNPIGSPQLAIRIAADINFLHTVQDNEGMCEGLYDTLPLDQELECQFRQRWRIE